MALVSILIDKATGRRRGTSFSLKESAPGVDIIDFHIDVTLTENHSFEADVTENPVEDGVVISDHIDMKPETITLTGVISDTPLSLNASIQGAATSAGAFVGKKIVGPLGAVAGVGAGAFAGLLLSPNNRMKTAFDHLRDLQSKRVPFTVLTGLKRYTNMVITSLTINRDSKSGRSFNFTATLKQIRIVQSGTVDIKNTFSGVSASAKKDLGKKTVKEVTPDKKTLLLKAFTLLGRITGIGA